VRATSPGWHAHPTLRPRASARCPSMEGAPVRPPPPAFDEATAGPDLARANVARPFRGLAPDDAHATGSARGRVTHPARGRQHPGPDSRTQRSPRSGLHQGCAGSLPPPRLRASARTGRAGHGGHRAEAGARPSSHAPPAGPRPSQRTARAVTSRALGPQLPRRSRPQGRLGATGAKREPDSWQGARDERRLQRSVRRIFLHARALGPSTSHGANATRWPEAAPPKLTRRDRVTTSERVRRVNGAQTNRSVPHLV
jgi:hypothetical protein